MVFNKSDEILMIFRRGKWDLPKGKLDKGETIAQCAIREIEEETAVSEIEIIKKLPDTYHLYNEKNKMIIKHCYWFLMKTDSLKNPSPQIEEDISDVIWVKKEKIPELMKNTFPSIKYILDLYFKNKS